MNKISLIEGGIGFFGFPVLDIFEICFSVFSLKIFGLGFPLFLIRFGFQFLLKGGFSVFVIRLSSSQASSL